MQSATQDFEFVIGQSVLVIEGEAKGLTSVIAGITAVPPQVKSRYKLLYHLRNGTLVSAQQIAPVFEKPTKCSWHNSPWKPMEYR